MCLQGKGFHTLINSGMFNCWDDLYIMEIIITSLTNFLLEKFSNSTIIHEFVEIELSSQMHEFYFRTPQLM